MRVIFSAGGTGGHLYPALALARYIKTQDVNNEILFVGSKYRIEASEVENNGFDFFGLDIKTPGAKLKDKIKPYYEVFKAVRTCKKLIKQFQPDLIIGFGGYTSYSVLKAGIKMDIPTIIHEQNSIIGKSNEMLLSKVDALISCYKEINDQLQSDKVHLLGNPTSYTVLRAKASDLSNYGLSNEKKTVLIVMGSQGSYTMNEIIKNILNKIDKNVQVIYVSGHNYYKDFTDMKLSDKIKIIEYEPNLVNLIKACDLIVSRAGASSLTEIVTANKASILIPSIHVANNHQYYNALALTKAKCSILIEENDNLEDKLLKTINKIIKDDKLLKDLSHNTKKLVVNDSVQKIYELMQKVAKKNKDGEQDE
jgi:UDP-N-acetylglucosamine--N-acetylmuramyl-(pentapeptide) pyrophosphoryl-undecaprenol N-acetylglucosamine transferase